MEKVSRAQLNNALTEIGEPLRRQLSSEDGSQLTAILDKAQRRWPNQDTAESMEEYLEDIERLCLKYSLPQVAAALDELRIDPAQNFFPTPNKISARIEAMINLGAAHLSSKATQDYLAMFDESMEKTRIFREAWLASGLALSEFCATDERPDPCQK